MGLIKTWYKSDVTRFLSPKDKQTTVQYSTVQNYSIKLKCTLTFADCKPGQMT